jgi:hypothetical protein
MQFQHGFRVQKKQAGQAEGNRLFGDRVKEARGLTVLAGECYLTRSPLLGSKRLIDHLGQHPLHRSKDALVLQ